MNTSESFEALRRANPRLKAGFPAALEAAADAVRDRLDTGAADGPVGVVHARHHLPRLSAASASLAVVAVAAALTLFGSPGGGQGVDSAVAAVKAAATVTAASAERSGTASVRISHNGELWAGSTVRWHDQDLSVTSDAPRRPGRAGSKLLLVDGTLYGIDPRDGDWVALGSPKSIDPGSGTTPEEYLAAVREDVGDVTLRRITDGMTGLTTRRLDDGSVVYSGTVAAGVIARESGFKDGQPIRVLPFGYVAQDAAADPSALLAAAVSVGVDGIVREIAVMWGTGTSAWWYVVTYRGLGTTSAPVAPANARRLRERSPAGE